MSPNIIKKPRKIIPNLDSIFTHRSKKQIKIIDSEPQIKKFTSRQLIYSKPAKQLISDVPKLIKTIFDLSNNKLDYLKIKLKGRTKANNPYICEIYKNNITYEYISNDMLYNDYHYLIKFKCNGQIKKYFGKQINNITVHLDGRHGFNEMLGLDYLSKIGINIVKPQIGFSNEIGNKSFIFYEYMDPKEYLTCNQAYEQGKLTKQNILDLNYKLPSLRNKKIIYNGKRYYFRDINTRNTFIHKKTGKLYIFDPWFSTMPIEKR